MHIPQEIRTLVETGTPAHLVTINRDGSPQVTLVWIGLDGDDIISGHLRANQKVKNIRRNPRVAISLQSPSRSAMKISPNMPCSTAQPASKKAGRRNCCRGWLMYTWDPQ